MTMNITMTVKANSTNNAEQIAMRELMNLAKTVSFMGSGSGNATHISDCVYEVKANVSVASEINDTNIANTMMSTFMKSPDIISSFVYIGSDEHKANEVPKIETAICKRCGKEFPIDEMIDVSSSDKVYPYCEECLDEAVESEEVFLCDCCTEYVTELVENPVTNEASLCPYCGHDLF